MFGDIISVHAALTPETCHMLDAGCLKLIRDKTLLIYTARGAIFDPMALERELGSGRLSAVLDVFEEEPLPLENPLRRLPNVILNPHMADKPAREEMTYAMVDEIARWLSDKPLQHEISYQAYKLMTNENVTTS